MIVTRVVILYIRLIVINLVLIGISEAKLDMAGVVGVWLLNEGEGVIVRDSSENGNHGEFMGNPKWVDGKIATALEFDGDDRVDCGDIEAIDGFTGLTVMAWCRWDGKVNGLTSAARVISKQDPNKGDKGPFSLGSGWRAHKLTLWINSGAWAGVHSITSIDDGRWHHVTGVYDGNHLKVYVDGLEEGKNKIGKVIGGSTPEHVAIGSDGFGREFWQGVIDEVALFNVALTDKDVKQFMNEGLSSLVMAVSASGKLVDTWSNLKTCQ